MNWLKKHYKTILIIAVVSTISIVIAREFVFMKLTKNFSKREFDSKDGSPMPQDVLRNVKELAKNLQVLRDHLGAPITINSGYRSPHYNDVVLPSRGIKTSKNSFHKRGMAADIAVNGFTPAQVKTAIEDLIAQGKMKNGGIGLYSTFVHYDIRTNPTRW